MAQELGAGKFAGYDAVPIATFLHAAGDLCAR